MIGNDIVDLRTAAQENNWQRKGYLDKIYTPEEQQIINNDLCPDRMVWLLWSMKESAYKIHNRETGLRYYAPLKLQCAHPAICGNSASGQVFLDSKEYTTTSYISKEHIHTIALPAHTPGTYSKIIIKHNARTASAIAQTFLTNGYYLYKNKYGLPYVMHRISGQQRFASLSHHGQFTALAIGAAM